VLRKVLRAIAPACVIAGVALCAVPARAGDVFAGVYDHGLFVPSGSEHGEDFMLGYRTAPIQAWTWLAKPSVHLMISGNSAVSTDFVALGLNWRLPIGFGGRLYLRPGFGIAYTNGEANVGNAFTPGLTPAEHERRLHISQTRIDFGSHDQFEPEAAIGYQFSPRWALEASYVHLSNGQIFHHGKNQGLDDAGLRVAYTF
jgi:lipid A 3-O-deacylase